MRTGYSPIRKLGYWAIGQLGNWAIGARISSAAGPGQIPKSLLLGAGLCHRLGVSLGHGLVVTRCISGTFLFKVGLRGAGELLFSRLGCAGVCSMGHRCRVIEQTKQTAISDSNFFIMGSKK